MDAPVLRFLETSKMVPRNITSTLWTESMSVIHDMIRCSIDLKILYPVITPNNKLQHNINFNYL
jgi:hypothetical protein